MKLTHVLGPELPDSAGQRARLLSAGTSSLHAAVSLAVKPVQVTWLLAVFSTSSSVLSVPHGDSVTAGTRESRGQGQTCAYRPVTFLFSFSSQYAVKVYNQTVTNVSQLISYCRPTVMYFAEEN